MEQKPDFIYIISLIFLLILFFIAMRGMVKTGISVKKTGNSNWERRVSKHFEGIQFPILIVRPNSQDAVETLQEYLNDPDLYFHNFPLGSDLIDSKGYRYVWLFDQGLQAGIPSEKGDPVSFEEFKCLVMERFPKLQQVQYTSNESFSTIMQQIIKGP